MRKIKLFLTLLMLMCIGITQMWGGTPLTATLQISSGVTENGNLTDDQSSTWAVSSDGTYTSNSSYIQCGTNKANVSYIRLTTSAYSSYKITKVQVWGTSKANTNVTTKVTIGSTKIGESASAYSVQNASSGGTEFSVDNTNNISGDITVEISRPSSAQGAIYFNKLIVTYEENGDTPPTCTNKVTLSKGAATFDIDKATSEALDCCAEMVVTLSNINIPNGKRIKAITQSGIEGVTIDQENKTVTYPADSNGESTIDVTFEDIPTHAIHFNTGGLVNIDDATDIQEGTSYNIYQTPAGSITDICEYKTFVGWTRSSSITNASVCPDIEGASIEMGNGDITLYAVYSKTEGGSTPVNDVLDRALTGVENGATGYSNWSGKKATSNAVYSGNSAGSNNAIQLRSNNSNSGIVTTTSGGNATKVTVDWESHTDAARTIDIYGKSTAYSAATDLYNSSNQGTKLGSITKSSGTELTITGEYAFIGIRSNSGALYLNSVTITWGGGGSTTYSLNPNCVEPECTNPTINTQPAESAEYAKNAGSVTALSVAATAATGKLTYQWYSNTTASNEGGEAIDGATNASYTPAVDVAGIFYYYCVVGIKDDVCKTASDVATITVTQAVESVAVDESAIALEIGATKTLVPTVLPEDATNKAVAWESSNPAVATVDENGLVTAVAKGSATITCKSQEDANIKATCAVTVTAPLPTITITADQLEDFKASYDDYDWSINGVQGIVGAYKNSGMQFNPNQSGYYAYNTTAIPGNITKIAMTKASGTTRSWTPYVSDEAMTTADANKALEAKAVEGTVEWNVTGSNQYFYLQVSGGATVIASIVITYEPVVSAVTIDPAIEHGSVDVTGAEDLTAVAAGTELTLTNTPSDEYQLKDYNVFKTGEPATKIAVTNGKFIMPLYGVTVSAEFEEAKELDHLVITNEASQKTFWVSETFNSTGLTIKAVYDNETEKENVTPKSISTPDMNEAGPKTVTIAYEEKGIEKTITYDITVKAHPTDPTKPCSVVEALDYLDKFDELEGAYVTGKVSEIVTAYDSYYGNISYNISDDGETTSAQLLVYRGKDFSGEKFPNADAIQVGDSVVVTGKIFTFTNTDTKEFAQDNQIFYRPKKVESIALSEGYKTAFNDNEEFSHEGVVVTATYNYGADEPVTATWSEPVMTQLGEQEVTVSYTYEGKTVEFKYTITITHVCAQENLVAVTKGEEVNGAYSLSAEEVCTEGDGATVDVTDIIPAEGYRFKEITATAGTVDNDLKKVSGIDAATTITVVFEQIPSYDVTWNVNGETSTTKVQEGSKPIFPTPNPASCDATSTAFYGWATAAWTGKAENLNEKTVYTSADDMDPVTAEGTIYYAVFAKADGAGSAPTEYIMNDNDELNANWEDVQNRNAGIQSYAGKSSFQMYGETNTLDPCKLTSKAQFTNITSVSMNVAANKANTVTLYYSANGTDWTAWENTISVSKNTESYTDYAFNMTNFPTGSYYIRLSNSTSSMYLYSATITSGSAPTYTDYLTTCCTKYSVTIDSEIEHGSVSADLAKACEGATVTLTPAADPAYHFDAWSVSYNDGENDHPVTVTENKFTMPAFDVTVSATFEHDECTQLGTPANVEAVADYKSAILDWGDVENADHYVVTIKKGAETVESNTVDVSEYVVGVTLLANKTYTYEIQATANDALTHCPSVVASDDFDTDELPEATLTLSENGEEYTYESQLEPDTLYDVVTLPSTLHFSGCTGKVLKGWSKVAVAEQDEEPTENYYAAGAQYTIGATADKLYAVFATEGAGQASTLFSETFDACNGTGANDDNGWSGSIASATLPNALSNSWAFVKGNAAYQCAKFGTGSAKGSAETPTIELTGAATLTFKAGAWNGGSEGTTLNLSATGATLDKSSVEMTKGAWTSYTVAITNANGSVKIKFEAKNASNNRFFLDDVVVSQSAISYSAYTTSCDAALEVPTFSLNPVVTPVNDEYQDTINVVIATAVEGATIYYTTNGDAPTTESDVYSAPIELNTCGTHTIKAFVKKDAQESAIATATYTLAIPLPENSKANPYTPEQAIAAITSKCYNGTDSIAVKGVVKTSSGLNTTYGNYDNIVVVAEETTEPEFTFYRMYMGANNAQFDTNDPAIAGGDTIVAYGILTKHNDTYQLAQGCYLISRKEMKQAKLHIESSLENPISIANAINYVDNGATYDLSEEVYVKGVANAAPNSYGTFTAHDANVVNLFQFYDANLNELTIVANDTVIVKGLITLVGTNYRMTGGVVQQVTAYKEHKISTNPAEVAFDEVEQNATSVDAIGLNVYLTNVESATVTLTDENNVFGINQTKLTENGVVVVSVTNTNVEVGPYAATITIHDDAGVAADKVVNVTMTITADPRKKAQDIDGFDATSGNLNSEISFASVQGDGTAVPALQSNGSILYYQPASGKAAGGYMTLTAVHGCKIDQVKVVTATHATNIKYSKDGGELSEASDEIAAGGEYLTPASLDAETINIYCAGDGKNHRLYIAQVVVYYTGEAIPVHHKAIDITGMEASQFEFPKNGTFTHEGLKVYACYDENCNEKVEITADCHVEADLTTTGEKKAKVYYGEEFVDEYDINVIAGQENPALAYTPTSETIAAANVASWSAPVFSNPLNVSPISFSSNNTAVATVDENGVIALAGGYGTAKITASFEETEDYIASEATYTITIQEPVNKIDGDWRLVTSTADITVGSKVIIVGTKNNTKYAMGEQKSNNRAAVAVVSEDATSGVIEPAEGTKTFTLVDAGDGMYAFKANNGKYLYAAGSTYLREQATINGNASWTITITSGGTTIEANGTNSNKSMRMNPNAQNDPLFSSYASGQNAVTLYVNRKEYVAPAVDPENPTPATPVAINTNVEEEEIVASGNVVVTVNTDNFEEPKSYIAQNGATIVINGNGAEEAKSVIADEQSTIQVNQQTTVNQVFSVSATMGAGLSGQITGVDNVAIAESTEAYFDITLGADATSSQWHAIAVPFPVDAINGVYNAETGEKLTNEVNYAIMSYHGDIRAQGLYGWKKYRGILQPGVFYLMTVDGDTKTFRFKMSGTTLPTATSLALQLYAASGAGQSTDAGWNGVANPTLQHGTVNQTVLVLNPTSYTYEDHDAGSYNFVVGTPFFIQANATIVTEGMEMGAVNGTKPYYAPKQTSENSIENIKVFFGNEAYKDKLTISANEEALNEYQIGKDLIKMTMTNTPKVAQIFGNAYNAKLCRVYAPMANDQATYSLTLYAPNAGEYTISAPEMNDADIYLTYNDAIVWNISMSEFTLDLQKGNNEGYGLILVKKAPQVTTGVDEIETSEAAQKVIIDEHVFILRGGKMYDVNGKMVK